MRLLLPENCIMLGLMCAACTWQWHDNDVYFTLATINSRIGKYWGLATALSTRLKFFYLCLSISDNIQEEYRAKDKEVKKRCRADKKKWVEALASTPPGMPGTHPHQYFGWWGRQWEYPHQPTLVSLCSLKQNSFGHKMPHCRQFASFTQVDSGLTRLQQAVHW